MVILHSSIQASDFLGAQLKSDPENLSAAETAVGGGDLLLSWSSRVQDFLRPAYGRRGDNPIPHLHLVVPLFSPSGTQKEGVLLSEKGGIMPHFQPVLSVWKIAALGVVLVVDPALGRERCGGRSRAGVMQQQGSCCPYGEALVT